MRTAFIETLCELAEHDERIWLLTGDLGYSVLERFADRFPDRYVNVGVAEQNMVGVATGLAMQGKVVFIYSIANFPTFRPLEQIRNDVCYHKANVKIVTVGGGLVYGAQGYTHHGIEDIAIMKVLPNMTVFAPGDPVETRLATEACVEQSGPCYLRLGRGREPIVHQSLPDFQIGKAIILRGGTDVTIISTGGILNNCIQVAEQLAKDKIQAKMLSMHTVKPIDSEAILEAVRGTRVVVTVEEHSVIGGLGSAVAEVIAESGEQCVFRRIGLKDSVCYQIGSQEYLRESQGLSVGKLLESIRRLLKSSFV